VGGDGDIAVDEDGPGPFDAGRYVVGVASGVLIDGSVDNVSLGSVGKRRQIADSIFGSFVDLDR
jgi:hypothetical protein